MKAALIVILLSAFIGCATNSVTGEHEISQSGQIVVRSAVRAATIRLIDSIPLIDGPRTIEVISEIRARIDLDGEITAGELLATAEAVIDFDVLSAYERMLIEDILVLAESRLESDRSGNVTARAGELLDWIESAARISQ